jgi:hypothetical protein
MIQRSFGGTGVLARAYRRYFERLQISIWGTGVLAMAQKVY